MLTYYQTDRQFWILAPYNIASFTIIGSNLNSTQFNTTINSLSDWTLSHSTNKDDGGRYDITMTHSSTADFNTDTYFLRDNKSQTPFNSSDNTIVWTNDTSGVTYTASTQTYNSTTNTDVLTISVGSGGGDPHIIPLINPDRKIFLLPTTNKIYNYFDNNNDNERVVVNAKMWILSNDKISKVLRLKRRKHKAYKIKRDEIVNHINDNNPDILDTSFMRYICFNYIKDNINECVIIDMENLDTVTYENDLDVDTNNYNLIKYENRSKYINVSDINNNPHIFLNLNRVVIQPNRDDYKMRMVEIKTDKHIIKFRLSVDKDEPNHRNHIEIMFDHYESIQNRYTGALIDIHSLYEVNSLNHILNINKTLYKPIQCSTADEYAKMRRKIIKERNSNN